MPKENRPAEKQSTADKKAAKKTPKPFNKSSGVEQTYARQLRKLGREVGRIISGYKPNVPGQMSALRQALTSYADIIKPWAKQRAEVMINSVNRQDRRAWASATKEMSLALRDEINNTPLGAVMQTRLDEQVNLITSIPIDAAKRVHNLTVASLSNSARASEIAKEIMRSGEVSEAHATLIARTEVSRTSTILTQARAENIGSDGYIWRTAKDSDVRESHKKMEGKFVPWNKPPTLDGMTGHAGSFPNCRCYPEPVIPEKIA